MAFQRLENQACEVIRITNPAPAAGKLEGFNLHQHGAVGDITASRKVRVTDEEDQPKSSIEAEADAEDRRQQLLLDRIGVRMDREYAEGREPDFAEIMEEEREKLRKERGEPEPEPLTPEQEAEQEA